MTWLVYPDATHRRFEHSLGVMELAGRVYDVVTDPRNVSDDMRRVLEPLSVPVNRAYWRRAVRMAALCHDIGHLPFSHAAEKELLPEGWDHERLTWALISSDEMKSIWDSLKPPLRHKDIQKLAVGPGKLRNSGEAEFTDWESIMAEIIVGDAFGVDRIDYLLRDSHHAGVAYGKFDHYRLIDTLRILPAIHDSNESTSSKPALGMEEGGIRSAEALMFARYSMYSQMYFHPVRRIYDIHLKDFLKKWLPKGLFSTKVDAHLKMTDSEITDALWKAAFDKKRPGHRHARRIVRREHFKLIYEQNPEDAKINPDSGSRVYRSLVQKYGSKFFRRDNYRQRGGAANFPVRLRDGRILSSLVFSDILRGMPSIAVDFVFADRSRIDEARAWVDCNRANIIKPEREEDDG